MNLKLPTLSYEYNAMEPYIDEKTMKIHHTKHHQTYINNANHVIQQIPELHKLTIKEIIKNINNIPKNKQNILKNNVGGHINHNLFWKILKKNTVLNGEIKKAIIDNFNSIESFKNQFEKISISHFGSGWTWLIVTKNKKLSIVTTSNQDNPLMKKDISDTYGNPILGLDLWEHAYYLKYQNNRMNYIKAFWNIINWKQVNDLLIKYI